MGKEGSGEEGGVGANGMWEGEGSGCEGGKGSGDCGGRVKAGGGGGDERDGEGGEGGGRSVEVRSSGKELGETRGMTWAS